MHTTDFTLEKEQALAEVNGTARLWRHTKTGAGLLSITNKDENKCFGVAFRTPPKDSRGVAHILEHSVLCGSDKYPVKEPFISLLKGSLQTFLNAFTFPDKTCYPVASANLADFYNLIDVYIDAVFHPLITEDTFRQEGWHLEAETPEGPWQYRGVVFNEMKGAYSSSAGRLAEESQHAIFPDMLYSLDAGGRPDVIPDLSYKDFCDFHARYYHPSNARFFFWGDDPEEERLEIVGRALEGYGARPVDSAIPLQPPFAAPRRVTLPYAAQEGETKALFTVNWLLSEGSDMESRLLFDMLDHVLEGMPGSPLRRALISSGLGEDTAGGLETDLRQLFFSAGLRGIAENDIPKAEALIMDTLERLACEGVPQDAVEAAVNTVEFACREDNYGSFPRGLAAMLNSLSSWLYDGDPLAPLAWEKPLARLKARIASGEKVFEDAIRTWLLDNPSRATVVLVPDKDLARRLDEAEQGRVEAIRQGMDEAQRRAVCEQTAALAAAQVRPDSPEAIATIPNLRVEDMPKENRPIPREVTEEGGDHYIAHELPTNGIAYMSVLLPMPQLPARLLPLMPLFLRVLRETGTARRDFSEMGALIAAKTGGAGFGMAAHPHRGGETRLYLTLAGKAVPDRIPDLFDIFREMLLEPVRDSDLLFARMREMLPEAKAGLEQALVASGHGTVSQRIRARYSRPAVIGEATSGVAQLRHVHGLLGNLEANRTLLAANIEELRRLLVARRGAIVDCTADAAGIRAVFGAARGLLADLPSRPAATGAQALPLLPSCPAEFFSAPTQVNYVGKGCNLTDLGYAFHGSALVILRYLRMGYLWDAVRVRGGAYGVTCGLKRETGDFVCTSYRDPNVQATLAAYDGIAGHLASHMPGKEELVRAIVGATGDLDVYLLPDARGGRSLMRWLRGESEEELQKIREEVLSTTAEDFRQFAEVMAEARDNGIVSVVGGAKAEEEARAGGWKCEKLF